MKAEGLSRVSKDILIREIEKELKRHASFIITRYGTVSATSLDKLRARLRPSGSKYLVVKNTLSRKAFGASNFKQFSEDLSGACGIVFTGEDAVQPSKVLVEFAKENEVFKIQAAYVNGEVLSVEQVKTLASLPPREVLLARVAGGMQSPLSRFVNVLSGTVRKVVNVLDSIAKKKGDVK